MKKRLIQSAIYALLTMGIALSLINLYGLTRDIRPDGLYTDNLRFDNDLSLDYQQARQQIVRKDGEGELEYAARLSRVISQSIAHIHWKEETDTNKYHQLVPIWENYFLYLMGKFSGIPEYKKYHYADYERSLRRGIGICGDASMIMSQLLDQQGITNQIVSFPGHVVLAAKFDQHTEFLFDPDFGVAVPYSPEQIQQMPPLVNDAYSQGGYGSPDVQALNHIYNKPFKRWNGVSHFITKKYYFEKVAYWLKWPLPLLLIVFAIWAIRRSKSVR